jgi:photosystem II biogenesis protein Psp29
VNTIRTVSDAKRDFYTHHNRPINSIYRQVVEELLVEMHLLSVNADFRQEPIYCLGVVSAFDRFLAGYQPQKDRNSIFTALCQAVGGNPDHYRQEAQGIMNLPENWSMDEFLQWLSDPVEQDGTQGLSQTIRDISHNPNFKYSRLFAIGLYTLMEKIDPESIKDNQKRNAILEKIADTLNFSQDKIQKDLDIYRSNLEKMEQVLTLIQETIETDRKKREERQTQKNEAS